MIAPDRLAELDFFRGLPDRVLARLAEAAEIREYGGNDLVVHQHDRAIAVYFLLSGTIQFLIRVQGGDEDLLVGVSRRPGTLIGWSVFRAPYRYTTSARTEQRCRLIRIPHDTFDALPEDDPEAAVEILRRVGAALADRLEQERERLITASRKGGAVEPARDEAPHSGHTLVRQAQPRPDNPETVVGFLRETALFERVSAADLERLAGAAHLVRFAPGDVLFERGAPATDMFLLLQGRVGLAYGERDERDATFLRSIGWHGAPLGWSAMVAPYRYHLTAVATEPTDVVALSRDSLETRCREVPAFGLAFLRRILQLIGYRLGATRVRLVARRYNEEAVAIRTLLDHAAETLKVTSPLHKLPYLLENRLTLADAIHMLELSQAHGDEAETGLAALCLDILREVQREIAIYRGLQKAYEVVANAPPDRTPQEVRTACMEEFTRFFDGIRYVIAGTERLPEGPGHIVIMNHLENHPDNLLPNDFRLTLDTHFVSSMVLYPKYGEAPIRVIRKPGSDWYGFQEYFDRLDYIYVYPGEVDEEDRDRNLTRADRQRLFLDRARAHLLAGRNVVIAPEGACHYTENSPGPFRAGAFRLAAYTRPEPLMVPVAVANFDKKLSRTVVAAVVEPPFRLSEKVPDPDDGDALADFVRGYGEGFRAYVEEAIRLAGR